MRYLNSFPILLSFSVVSGIAQERPNVIVILVDDLGYGDLGCYGNTLHRTPNIDKMAQEGNQFLDFYAAAPVSTPSRASLLTGCYPRRIDMHFDEQLRPVLFPSAMKGLNTDEKTIAEILKDKGYSTACIGKWHLGDQKEFFPTRQGFDYYFGIPYSNDMGFDATKEWKKQYPPLPLLENEKVLEAPVVQKTLTYRYTQKAVQFIEKNARVPFFLYLPHNAVHTPLFASDNFLGKSANVYSDVVEEVDWSTGEILNALRRLKLDKNTLVIFTSDNGAAKDADGSNRPFSGWKGETLEGGMRVPCIMWWPGVIPPGSHCTQIASLLDILPTITAVCHGELPQVPIDGKNIFPLMKNEPDAKSPHEAFYYYMMDQLQAVRVDNWKLHIKLHNKYQVISNSESSFDFSGALYNLEEDLTESNNLFDQYPAIVDSLMKYAAKIRNDIGDYRQCTPNVRSAGYANKSVPLLK